MLEIQSFKKIRFDKAKSLFPLQPSQMQQEVEFYN